jgi:multicomponent Na+:H+ antiporter subunit G
VREILSAVLLLVGATFTLLAAVGVLRMPDVFTRMQVATKAASLGATCMLLGVAVFFAQLDITVRAVLIIGFIFLTAPVSAHMVARAAYAAGVPLWEGTILDELRGRNRPGADPPPDAERVDR